MRLDVSSAISDGRRQSILDGLAAYNAAHVPADGYQPLAVTLDDDEGRLIGGLLGESFWGWLRVGTLWVDEAHRGAGHGSALLVAAEEEARRRGCTGIFVDTMDFQAPAFYQRHGYSERGRIDDLPAGHCRHHFQKMIDGTRGGRAHDAPACFASDTE